MGKHRPDYYNCAITKNEYCIIINADKFYMTGGR